LGIFTAVQTWWARRPELRRVVERKGSNGAQPGYLHRREGGGRWTPLSDAGAAGEDFRDGRPTPVVGPQGDDADGSQLAHGDSGVIFRQAMAGQIGEVSRVQGRGLGREAIDEHIVRGPGGRRRR